MEDDARLGHRHIQQPAHEEQPDAVKDNSDRADLTGSMQVRVARRHGRGQITKGQNHLRELVGFGFSVSSSVSSAVILFNRLRHR